MNEALNSKRIKSVCLRGVLPRHPCYLSLFGMLQIELRAVAEQFEINFVKTIKLEDVFLLQLTKISLYQIVWVHFTDFVFRPQCFNSREKVVFSKHLKLMLKQKDDILLHCLDLQKVVWCTGLLTNSTGVPVRCPVVPERIFN